MYSKFPAGVFKVAIEELVQIGPKFLKFILLFKIAKNEGETSRNRSLENTEIVWVSFKNRGEQIDATLKKPD